jgi:deazaflavin-dependent oxidoreductase (nitroreductase family)
MPESNRTFMRIQWRLHKALWNASSGRLGRRVVGMPVVEVVTVGRRSGVELQILITYVQDGGAPAIVGTNAGRDADPAWAHNLRANPDASARWDGTWHDIRAVELDGEPWERAWAAAVAANPGYADYAAGLSRPIPIFRLEPRS